MLNYTSSKKRQFLKMVHQDAHSLVKLALAYLLCLLGYLPTYLLNIYLPTIYIPTYVLPTYLPYTYLCPMSYLSTYLLIYHIPTYALFAYLPIYLLIYYLPTYLFIYLLST